MRTEEEIRGLLAVVDANVKHGTDIGLHDRPSTFLEQHAFELGKRSVLLWLTEEKKTDEQAKLSQDAECGSVSS